MDGTEKANYLILKKKVLHEDWDGLIIVDGIEGTGKSTKAQQIGGFFDPTLNMDRIVFTAEEFERAIINAKKGQCVIWDEADMASSDSVKKQNKALKRRLQLIREKNLFIIIVAPYIFMLDKYLVVGRARALIHCYTKEFKRGFFSFYNQNRLKSLVIRGSRNWNYRVTNPNFRGRYVKGYWVDEKEYRKKKREQSQANSEVEESVDKRYEWIGNAYYKLKLKQKDIGIIFGLDQSQISRIINNLEQ